MDMICGPLFPFPFPRSPSNKFLATRYHSLVGKPDTLPDVLEVTAKTENGLIMGVRHKELAVEGVQVRWNAKCLPCPQTLARVIHLERYRHHDPRGHPRRRV